MFSYCMFLQRIDLPNLVTISGSNIFQTCNSLQQVDMPNLVTINGGAFRDCVALKIVQFSTLMQCIDPFQDDKPNLRDVKIGQGTDINLPFRYWYATNVIAEGQSGIDELNTNLYNNLLTKLYDHSTDGETRTLRIGWLAHVSQENIDYANSKGWTLTT